MMTWDDTLIDRPHDECGVFGVWAREEDVARLTYFGLYALQHRGQESAGIAASDGTKILVYKDMGLVSQVFKDRDLSSLNGHIALGHVRYSTAGSSTWRNAQPTLGPTAFGTLALAHNGNLVNTKQLLTHLPQEELPAKHQIRQMDSSSDTLLLSHLINLVSQQEVAIGGEPPLLAVMRRILPQLEGAYSLAFIDENTLYAARDPRGMRPLVLGRIANGWVVSSETAALDIVGASFVREIAPGEIIAINENGVHTERFSPEKRAGCVFEYVYLARPDSTISGRSIIMARTEMGAALAREHPVDADMVMSTPDSGTPAAIGYAMESGVPFGQGLVKNAYVGRTFIQPTQAMRQMGIRLKLNPVKEIISGKRLVVVDDSIVRGNTQRAVVQMLRAAGASEVHIRVSSPPVLWPCYYGIDFATRAELIATGMDTEEIRKSIGADTLGYLSYDAMVAASGQPATQLCTACFSGQYPTSLPDFATNTKNSSCGGHEI